MTRLLAASVRWLSTAMLLLAPIGLSAAAPGEPMPTVAAALEVNVTEDIAAPRARVWAFVGDFAGVMRWHPQIVSCEVQGDGVGMVRTSHFADWWIAERLDRHDTRDDVIVYTVVDSSRPGVVGSRGQVELSSPDTQTTRLHWQTRLPDGTSPAVAAALGNYYRLRVTHLRRALGLPG